MCVTFASSLYDIQSARSFNQLPILFIYSCSCEPQRNQHTANSILLIGSCSPLKTLFGNYKKKARAISGRSYKGGLLNVCDVMQRLFSDVITACEYQHETKANSWLWACYELQMSHLCSPSYSMSATLFTNSANINLISYCSMTKASPV